MIICQQAIINVGDSTTAAVATGTGTATSQYRNGQREYGRYTITALMGGPAASLGAADQSPKAVSDFITFHGHNKSPQLKSLPLLTPPGAGEYAMLAGGGGPNKKRGNDGEKEHCAMSGLSLVMMNREENNIHSEHMTLSNCTHDICSAICDSEKSQQEQEYTSPTLPFSSSHTRAAFHDPPPLYPDDIQHVQSSGMTDDDETFLDKLPKSPFSDPMMNGASSILCESGNISLWNYNMADDQLDKIFIGGGRGADTTLSHAVSSLHQRCANEGKPRLKMFASTGTVNVGGSGGINLAATDTNSTPSSNFASLKDQLSDFRSFVASQ